MTQTSLFEFGEMSDEDRLRVIEHTIQGIDTMVRQLWPDFNSHRNAERIINSLNRANEALRQIQRGNMETVSRYWGDENES